MSAEVSNSKIKVESYGDLLAKVKGLELVSYDEDGGYQGEYMAVLKDDNRLFYYTGYYGSCSGCDFLEDVRDWNTGEVEYKEALGYCEQVTLKYIVPISQPLEFTKSEYQGFTFEAEKKKEF